MSKMSKAILALGVVAGLGVATLPLSSYAADYSQSAQAKVQVEVGGAISIAVDSGNTDKTLVDLGQLMVNGDVKTGSVDVIVSTNNTKATDGIAYNLTMSMAGESNALSNGNGATIPAGTPQQGDSAWGWTQSTITDADSIAAATWAAVPVKGSSAATLTTATGKVPAATVDADNKVTAGSETTTVTFGASADGNQQEGVYTGSVVFTATVNN